VTYAPLTGDTMSFTLPDPYEGWSQAQLRERVRELSSAVMEWQLIAANMGAAIGALDQLTEPSREKVKRIMDAYSDC
jgi:hypothetical protein